MDTPLRTGYAPPALLDTGALPTPEGAPATGPKHVRSVMALSASERPPTLAGAQPQSEPLRRPSVAPDRKSTTTIADRRVTVAPTMNREYLAFRKQARAGYNEALHPLRDLITKHTSQDAPSLPRLKQLHADFEGFCNHYFNPDSPKAVLMPPELVQQCAQDLVALTDFMRGKVAIKGDERDSARMLQARVANSLQAVRTYFADRLSDATIERDHKALQASPYGSSPGLRGILEDSRQVQQLEQFREACRKQFVEENLNFLLALQAARALNGTERVQAYLAIEREYVAAGSSSQINIDAVSRNELQQSIQALSGPLTASGTEPGAGQAADPQRAEDALSKAQMQAFLLLRDGVYMNMTRAKPGR